MTIRPDVLAGSGDAPVFSETQKVLDWWFYKAILVFMVVAMGSGIFAALLKGVLGAALWQLGTIAAIGWFFWVLRMETNVRADGVYARVFPLHLTARNFAWSDIDWYEAVTYRPIRDYGGWGIRWGWKGWAYNMYGNRGVLLHLKTGKTQMIGSQRPEELAAAISRAKD